MRLTIRIPAGIATAILVAGCTTTPNYDQRFGDAVRVARLGREILLGLLRKVYETYIDMVPHAD